MRSVRRMKITKFETVRIAEFPQLLWLYIHTDEGSRGLGETFFSPSAVEAYLHDDLAPRLLDRDPLEIDSISRDLVPYVGFRSTGVEGRAASAIDIAATWLMCLPAILTARASGFSRSPPHTSQVFALWYRPSSSLIQALSVSRKRRSMFGRTPSNGRSVVYFRNPSS